MTKTVYVGMSGGVDSSVTAALLKEQGYSVVGVFMKNWTEDLPGFPCPWKEDFQDAKRVAVQLGIDFKVYDFQKEYRQKVVDYMVAEYKAGRTPNPDIICNQEVKFKLFLNTALEGGADLIATGHYARVARFENRKSKIESQLHVAKNKDKDQTYFLYRISEEALSKTMFPIGEFKTKDEVRALAKKLGMTTADKKDSQGICFVGKVGIKDFLLHELGPQPGGAIIDQNGKEIGEHDGAIFYTIGQRHGLNVGGGLPYYVIGKDMTKSQIIVTTNLDDASLWKQKLTMTNVHWINKKQETGSGKQRALNSEQRKLQVRTRYGAPLVGIENMSDNGKFVEIELEDPVRAVTPGQSAVIYDGERVLGGGICM